MQEKWLQSINEKLAFSLSEMIKDSQLRERIRYSLLPAGKLFRPLLVHHLASDLGEIKPDHLIFSCSLEFHHCYTLIHDDLPAMDNDDERRGKPSAHIKYSEWEAILTGDSLLGLSFQILAKLETKHLAKILDIYGEKTGSNGLILGQIIDMQAQGRTIEEILRVHELKTAALMQLALIGSALISDREDLIDSLDRLGLRLGQNFQLLDDLCELTDDIQGHELQANPFLHFDPQELLNTVQGFHTEINALCQEMKLESLRSYIKSFEKNVYSKLEAGKASIEDKINIKSEQWNFLGNL